MGNAYEERLGTDRMLPLIFKMALPAVAAQLVNLLYNIVDRIYIGHIPGIGTDALAGIGVTGAVIILISSFSAIVGGGGSPLAAIALGQGDRERAGKILGNGFILLLLFTLVTSTITYIFMEPILLFTGASERTIGYATDYLHLSAGDIVRRTFRGIEHLHQYAGTSCYCHVFGSHWCHPEHRSGPAVYLHFQYGSKGSCTRHHPVTGMQRNLGNILSYFEKSFLATGTQVHEIT